MDLQLKTVTSALLCSLGSQDYFPDIELSSILSWDCPGILSNFSKISGQYHQCDQLKSLHHNVIITIILYGFTCKISPEATSELAASPKQCVGIYSITSPALSSHRSGKRIHSLSVTFPSLQTCGLRTCLSTSKQEVYGPSVVHSSCKCIGTQTIHFACNDVILPKEKWHFASWQRLHWPYSLCEGVFFTLIGSAWNNLQSTAVTRCKQPPTRLF